MSWGGSNAYKKPRILWGWANEEQPQTPQKSKGG